MYTNCSQYGDHTFLSMSYIGTWMGDCLSWVQLGDADDLEFVFVTTRVSDGCAIHACRLKDFSALLFLSFKEDPYHLIGLLWWDTIHILCLVGMQPINGTPTYFNVCQCQFIQH